MTVSLGVELRHLRYFLAVYEELHFGRAAERLHIAQPPLSQAIRKLERDLGVTLLDRTSRTVKATPAGDAFAEEARKVLAAADFAVTEARRVGGAETPMRIGCVSYVHSAAFQRFLSTLKARDASLRAEVVHLLGLEQVGRLRGGRLELGVFAHAEDYEGLDWERLFPGEPLQLYVGRDHRLARLLLAQPRDLERETLLIYPKAANPAFYDRYLRMFDEAGYSFAGLQETNPDPLDLMLNVANGPAVAVAPQSFETMALVTSKEVVSVPLDPPLRYPDTIVAWRADPPRQLVPRLETIRAAAAELFRATIVNAA